MRGLAWLFLFVCACSDGTPTRSTPALPPCAQAADVLEREARGEGVDVEVLRTAYVTLTVHETGRPCDPAGMARAAQAAITLLRDTRVIVERPGSLNWNVQDFAYELLKDMTGLSFGAFSDVDIMQERWRAWWAKSGADVERWLREGDE